MPDTKLSGMGHQVPLEEQTRERSQHPYEGPEGARRARRIERPVAVVGASADRAKFGNKAVRAYTDEGYTVWPVNPRSGEIEGQSVYADVRDLPSLPFIASIYLHEDAAIEVLEALADMEREAGDSIAVVYLNPGADQPRVIARAEDLGLYAISTCSIRAIGRAPEEFGAEGA
ncbi:MAG: CoA-binding protein [Coriobacteriia bacterium]|nr:CoA-binding protein [Coriobacteriia bacterium]